MFLKFKKINNESGVVLFIVLMTSIIIMIFSLCVLTQSMNEINYAQQQIDQITCDRLKKGLFWESEALGVLQPGYSTVISGRKYTLATSTSGGAWQFSCSYDTFQ